MKKGQLMGESKLHFTRIRAKGEPSFYDPATDIRKLLPGIAKVALLNLQEKYETNKELLSDFLYIHNCWCVMEIKAAEDPAPFADQNTDFWNALDKVQRSSLFLWMQTMFVLQTYLYGFFYRRDAKVDGAGINDMINMSRLSDFLTGIPDDLKEKLKDTLQLKCPVEMCDSRGFVVCEETGERMENIKQLASLFIPHTGANDWKSLADACDLQFSSNGVKSKEGSIALALAYPDYKHLCLTVEENKEK